MEKKKYYLFSLNMTILNIFSFFLLFSFVGIAIVIDKEFFLYSLYYTFDTRRILLTFVLVMGYLSLHEILHSISYYIYGAKFKNIVYGIELEKGIFYCLCKQNIKRKNILNSLFFPLFYIGILTFILSFILESAYLLILSIFNISGCIGDILTFIFICRLDKDIEFSEFDDTTSFGLYTNKEIDKINHFGLVFKGTTDKLIRNGMQKVRISKVSYIILVVMLIFSFITLFM